MSMAKSISIHLPILLAFVVTLAGLLCQANDEVQRKIYIVYMGRLPEDEVYSANSDHISMLQALGHNNNDGDLTHDSMFKRDAQYPSVDETLIRSYTRSFNGFVAKLTQQEAIKLEKMENVVSIFESQIYNTQTTRSWDYIGFPTDVPRNPPVESDVIIGSIDTGVTPESASFSDEGLDIVPKKWKGVCNGGNNITCNKKLIGVRYYGVEDGRDNDGHGTHTASTAAGREVPNSMFYGLANGTIRGAVPASRIAAYKVCDKTSCATQNILAAFDDAIADGVDIITISIGGTHAVSPGGDVIAIGAFHAMEKGILTLQSAGNKGASGVASIAPWLFSVAASSVDRKIVNNLVLGNGGQITSIALNTFSTIDNITLVTSNCSAYSCSIGCVDPNLVKGKIIVCNATDRSGAIQMVFNAGAAGLVLTKATTPDVANDVPFPAAIIDSSVLENVLSYINSTSLPYARIEKSAFVPLDKAPVVATFSGRGPNIIFPEILKPDISAPGIEILASYSPLGKLSEYVTNDQRSSSTNILSGTSMSCPHAAGAAAYVKSIHPDWSPSAIKSALMTTAYPMKAPYNADEEFGYGAGQINPLKATTPGLVYETSIEDYIHMFCSLEFEGDEMRKAFGIDKSCPKGNKITPKDLNYPSMTAPIIPCSSFRIQFPRTVTNVGLPNSTYHSEISIDEPSFHIRVEPKTLCFSKLKETKSFVVTVSGKWVLVEENLHISGSLLWNDGTYKVRSPIILYTQAHL